MQLKSRLINEWSSPGLLSSVPSSPAKHALRKEQGSQGSTQMLKAKCLCLTQPEHLRFLFTNVHIGILNQFLFKLGHFWGYIHLKNNLHGSISPFPLEELNKPFVLLLSNLSICSDPETIPALLEVAIHWGESGKHLSIRHSITREYGRRCSRSVWSAPIHL